MNGDEDDAESDRGRADDEDEDPYEAFRAELRVASRQVVRHPLLRRLRAQGEGQHRAAQVDARGRGGHLPDRGPDGGRRRDQERAAQDGHARPDPRLRARAHGAQRRHLVGRPSHARRHGLRGQRPQPDAAALRRGLHHAEEPRRDQGDGRPPRAAAARAASRSRAASPPRSTSRSARPSRSRKARSRACPARSARSSPRAASSRSSSRSSSARPRSSSSFDQVTKL